MMNHSYIWILAKWTANPQPHVLWVLKNVIDENLKREYNILFFFAVLSNFSYAEPILKFN